MSARSLLSLCLLVLLALSGCASTSGHPDDPWEGMNRKVQTFNDNLDDYAAKPVAEVYRASVPLPTRSNVSNFFGNLEDVWIGVNNLLQGKPRDGLNDLSRFAVNSTIGIIGFFDVATELGLEKHDEDFGQTLGRWGVPSGPYLVLPLVGPSSVRDAGGFVVDKLANYPDYFIESVPMRNAGYVTKFVDTRTRLLGAESVLEDAALDKYNYLRGFYLQRRKSQIYDGRPPREDDDYR
ncbi:VacJ family lipoprotein [Uliginosibacterium sp. TH139]|uniref:MlaA family lipoprotein n=1 Tax=Uliginosibacterium sp. TH139 TaxID=2067453 RepID=UPI00211044DA|nr:VacJ family lipoprotein [Uliginosibacterium sp. TH139]